MGHRFAFEKYRHLAVEWSTENGVEFDDDSVLASRHYLWKCSKDHPVYTATMANRAYHGSGCPSCWAIRRSVESRGLPKAIKPGYSLVERHPELRGMFDESKNGRPIDGIGPAGTRLWWRCERGHEWEGTAVTLLASLASGQAGCRGCYLLNKRRPKPGQSLGHRFPALAALWHPEKNGTLTAFDVRPNCNDYAYWICERGHETHAIINSRSSGFGCVHCRGFNKSSVEADFRALLASSPLLTDVNPLAHRMAINWSNVQNRQWMTVDIFGGLLTFSWVVIGRAAAGIVRLG